MVDLYELQKLRTVVLHKAGKPLQAYHNGTCWELRTADTLGFQEALTTPTCWVEIESNRQRGYIAFRVLAADRLFVQFTTHSNRMLAAAQRCGVREQLIVLKVLNVSPLPCTVSGSMVLRKICVDTRRLPVHKVALRLPCAPGYGGRKDAYFFVSPKQLGHHPRPLYAIARVPHHHRQTPHAPARQTCLILPYVCPPDSQAGMHQTQHENPCLCSLCKWVEHGVLFCSARGLACPLRSAFSSWRQLPALVRKWERQASRWHQDRRLHFCFAALRQYARNARDCRVHAERLAQSQHRLLERVLRSWKLVVPAARHRAAQVELVVKQRNRRTLLEAFMDWQTFWTHSLHRWHTAVVFRRSSQRCLLLKIHKAWWGVAAQRVVHIAVISRLHHKWNRRICAKALRTWKLAVLLSLQREGLWELTSNRMRAQLQRECFNAWFRVATQACFSHEKARYLHKACEGHRLRRVLPPLEGYCSSGTATAPDGNSGERCPSRGAG